MNMNKSQHTAFSSESNCLYQHFFNNISTSLNLLVKAIQLAKEEDSQSTDD